MGDWDDGDNCMAVSNSSQPQNVQGFDKTDDQWGAEPMKSEDAITFEVDHSNVGMVIGRGGSKIREIEEKFQVKLSIGKSFSRFHC